MVTEQDLKKIPKQDRQSVRNIQERVQRGQEEIEGRAKQIQGLQEALSRETDPFERKQITGHIRSLRQDQNTARRNVGREQSNVTDQIRRAQGKRSVADAAARDKVTDEDREIMRRARVEQVKRGSGLDKRERERIEREIRQGTFNPTREKLRKKNIATFQGVPIRAKQANIQTIQDGEVVKEERLPANQARSKITQSKRRQQRSRPRRTRGTVPAPTLRQGGRNETTRKNNQILTSGVLRRRSSNVPEPDFFPIRGGVSSTRLTPDLQKKRKEITKRIREQEQREKRLDQTLSLLSFGEGVPFEERSTVGKISQGILGIATSPVTFPLTFGGRASQAVESELFARNLRKQQIITEQDVKNTRRGALEDAAISVEKGPASFLPGGTPINVEGGLTLVAAAVPAAVKSSTSTPSTSTTTRPGGIKPSSRPNFNIPSFKMNSKNFKTSSGFAARQPVRPKIIAVNALEGTRIRTPQGTQDLARVQVKARQGKKNIIGDFDIVRESRPLGKDLAVGDILFQKSKSGISKTKTQGQLAEAGKPETSTVVRGKSLGVGEKIGGVGSKPSKFVSFTESKIVGRQGNIQDLPATVGAGRARKTAEILKESGTDTIIEVINPEFIARKPKKVANPRGLELFKINAATQKELSIPARDQNVFLPRNSRARISRLQSGSIGIGGRENINTIARRAELDLKAAASLQTQRKGIQPPKKQRTTNLDNLARTFEQSGKSRLQQTQKLQQKQFADKTIIQETKSIADLALRERFTEFKDPFIKPRSKLRGKSKTSTKSRAKTQFGTGRILRFPTIGTNEISQIGLQDQLTQPRQKQPQRQGTDNLFDVREDTFQLNKLVTDNPFTDTPTDTNFFTPTTPFPNDPFTPTRRQDKGRRGRGGFLIPPLQFPSGKKGKQPKGGGKTTKGFKPGLFELGFRVFSDKPSKQLQKQTAKTKGLGARPIGSEFEKDLKSFDKLFVPDF